MARALGIIAYGQTIDRQKVAQLASAAGQSVSEYLISTIRANYTAKFGDMPPLPSDNQK